MAEQHPVTEGIFAEANKVEILGKLPAMMWAYIETARSLVRDLGTGRQDVKGLLADMERVLGLLQRAAALLGNEELDRLIGGHSKMLTAFSEGKLSHTELVDSFNAELPKLEAMAGPRPESSEVALLDKLFSDKEWDQGDEVKSGRSSDLVVTIEELDAIRDYLASEVRTEGISSILLIDNAGTLIVNVGDKIDIDVVALAAVAAANFAATEKIAHLIGEQDFVLLFYKGHHESFHFSRVGQEYIIVTIFENSLSLGLLRLKIAEVIRVLEKTLPKREG
ncbi:MAG: roadblock/LC7 domain-containing protein [Deltaproteobacteria bacterium]